MIFRFNYRPKKLIGFYRNMLLYQKHQNLHFYHLYSFMAIISPFFFYLFILLIKSFIYRILISSFNQISILNPFYHLYFHSDRPIYISETDLTS
jgi:hypothetical protein